MKGKDLINIGIFSAIYFVIVFIVAMLGMIPIFLPLLAVIVPILGGIPFMLFLTRVKKFGMIWIMSVIMGVLMLLTGMSWPPLAVSVVSGLIAELIYKSGGYKSASKAVISLCPCGCARLCLLSHLYVVSSAVCSARHCLKSTLRRQVLREGRAF